MSMLLLDVFDRRRARDTLASRGTRVDTHYHIVTTFEAKESGAPGVLAQSLGIWSGWHSHGSLLGLPYSTSCATRSYYSVRTGRPVFSALDSDLP
jgi:hypothetical protein